MLIKVIGVGAAGNKAAISLIKDELLELNRVLLLNSTLKDIPEDFRNIAVTYSDTLGGCGKERDMAKNTCLKAIKNERLGILDSLVDPSDDLVVIVSSTEGGTGSGSVPIIAKYFKEVIGKPVMCFAFTGFEEDGRGLQNTIEYFQDMKDDYIVQSISNKRFMEEANKNKLKAEKMANAEFVKRISIILEQGIIDAEQNIDHTDMFKVCTTPGFMTINQAIFDRVKNVDQFNSIVTTMIDNDKSLEIQEKSQKRLAVFLNIRPETADYIDYTFEVIKSKLGIPYELFTHIQNNEGYPEYISIISSGMKMPIDEIKAVYERYKEESEKVNKKKDSFFDFASELRGNQDDAMFNTMSSQVTVKDKKSFFNDFNEDNNQEKNSNEPNSKLKSKQDFMKLY